MTSPSTSRRRFLRAGGLASTAGAMPLLQACGGGGGGGGGPTVAGVDLPLTLRGAGNPTDDSQYTLHVAGATIPLHSLDRAVPAGGFGAGAIGATHVARSVALPPGQALRLHVTRRPPSGGPGERRLALAHVHVPSDALAAALPRVAALRRRLGLPAAAHEASGAPGAPLSPISTAIAIVFHHPELMTFDGPAAAAVVAHIRSSPFLPPLWSAIAIAPGTDGGDDAWCEAVPITDPDTGLPTLDADGAVVCEYRVTDDVMALAGAVIRDVLATVKADESLEGAMWTPSEGAPSVVTVPRAAAGADAPKVRVKGTIEEGRTVDGLSFATRAWTDSSRNVTVTVSNAYIRWASVFVEFLGDGDRRLKLTPAQWQSAIPTGLFPSWLDGRRFGMMQTPELHALDLVSPAATVFAIPTMDGTSTHTIRMPADARTLRLRVGAHGLGVCGGPDGVRIDLLPFMCTALVNQIVPTIMLGTGTPPSRWDDLFDLVKNKNVAIDLMSFAMKGVKAVKAVFAGTPEEQIDAESAFLVQGGRLLLDIGDLIVRLLVNRALLAVFEWMALRATQAAITSAIPFAGWALRGAAMASTAVNIARTTAQVLGSDHRYTNDITIAADLRVTIHPDPDDHQFPATAASYSVQVVIAKTPTHTTGRRAMPAAGRSQPIVETLADLPTGGTGQVVVTFFDGSDTVVGSGYAATYAIDAAAIERLRASAAPALPERVVDALVPLEGTTFPTTPALAAALATRLAVADRDAWTPVLAKLLANTSIALLPGADGAIDVECTIEERLVALSPSTVYVHRRVLGFDGTAYRWNPTSVPRPVVPPTCDNAGDALCQLGAITVSQRTGQVGYAWRASSPGLRICGTSLAGREAWTVQSLSLGDDPNDRWRTLTLDGVRCGVAEGAGVVYQLLGASDGSGANFLIDGRSGRFHVRPLASLASNALELGVATASYGTFTELPDSIAWHPSGYVIGVNARTHKIEVLDVNGSPVDDALAPPAQVRGGLGDRSGLLRGPVAVAVSVEGVVLVLEADAQRVQAFDKFGAPVRAFGGRSSSTFALRTRGSRTRWLDIGVESQGCVYVLSETDGGQRPSDYVLDVHAADGSPLCSTHGFTAARLSVDLWRNVHTLNFETLRGRDGRTEPTVSEWVPT
jgi:hypothetical protein